MAVLDFICLACKHTFAFNRPVADWPKTPPCEQCGSVTENYYPPPRTTWRLAPVVVYQAPDGSFRFPPAPDSASAARYDREGYTRIELRSAADVRRHEKEMNAQEFARAQRRVERLDELHSRREAASRSEIRRGLDQGFMVPEVRREGDRVVRTGRMVNTKLSERGRDVMRAAIARNDAKQRPRAAEVGFHVQAFSYDRSNREESRDESGRRRRD